MLVTGAGCIVRFRVIGSPVWGYTPRFDRQYVNVVDVQVDKTVRMSVNHMSGHRQQAAKPLIDANAIQLGPIRQMRRMECFTPRLRHWARRGLLMDPMSYAHG
jgi:hypothetical protein